MSIRSALLVCLSLCLLCGCAQRTINNNPMVAPATVTDQTRAGQILVSLPVPVQKIPVVVYDFQDQTGQFKNNGQYTEYSSAVTKGGYSILIKALLDSGKHEWFTVVERGGLKQLLQERQIIKMTRAQYEQPDGKPLGPLPPLLYGGMMIEGGIISYDSNVVTGGAGAAFLGISGTTQYRRDLVSVYLRAINVQTGEVLLSVTSSKTIYSTSLDTNVIKYLTVDHLLQAEAGFTINEPAQLGVRQAIETAVYSLLMEGAINNLWSFKDPVAGKAAIDAYIARRDNTAVPVPKGPVSPQVVTATPKTK